MALDILTYRLKGITQYLIIKGLVPIMEQPFVFTLL